jgi:hypothetical protein
MWYIYKTVMKYVAELDMCSNTNCTVPFSRYIHSYKSGIWCDHRVLYLNILFCNLNRVISISSVNIYIYIYIYIYTHTYTHLFSFLFQHTRTMTLRNTGNRGKVIALDEKWRQLNENVQLSDLRHHMTNDMSFDWLSFLLFFRLRQRGTKIIYSEEAVCAELFCLRSSRVVWNTLEQYLDLMYPVA